MRRWKRLFGGLVPAGMAGAFFALILRLRDPEDANRFGLLLAGGLYGIAIVGLIRLFRVAPWCYPIVGLVCGPVPFAILANQGTEEDMRIAMLPLTAILGLIVGCIEWARVRRGNDTPEP